MTRPRKRQKVDPGEWVTDSVPTFMENLNFWMGLERNTPEVALLQETERFGFQLSWKGYVSETIWLRYDQLDASTPWGRGLSTVEGRLFIAHHEFPEILWAQETPRWVDSGVVIFDP